MGLLEVYRFDMESGGELNVFFTCNWEVDMVVLEYFVTNASTIAVSVLQFCDTPPNIV